MSDEFVPPEQQCVMCDDRAVDPTAAAPVCETHQAALESDTNTSSSNGASEHAEHPQSDGERRTTADTTEATDTALTPSADTSEAAHRLDWDFTTTHSGQYPPTLLDREQWMGRAAGRKMPFSPWSDRDHPEADADTDARWKWGLEQNYVDGEKVAMAEADPQLDGRVFIQQEADPFAFVDGDDVRCPETGEVHPEFIRILQQLGETYADVSTSGSGVHGMYRGDIPGEQGQAVFQIDDEPFGANDEPPTVEIYANKHVCVTTGEQVAGSPDDVNNWDTDAVEELLNEYDARKDTDSAPASVDHDTDRDRPDLDGYNPDATHSDETTTEIRDILAAVDRLQPRDLPLQTGQVGTDATGWEKWDPSTYRTSSGGDSLHRPPDEPIFHDFKHNESFGVLSLLAAEKGILRNPWDRLAGEDWWNAIEAARDQGAPIPEYVGGRTDGDAEQTAMLPPSVRDLTDAASGWDWRHAARQDDSTLTMEEARQRTCDAIAGAYTSGDQVLIEALPTMGKSFGAIKAAADTGEQVTILTGRGRKEQYEQIREWCDERGLSCYTLPSFTHDCPTASGEFGEEWADKVRDWYNRGASPQEIHKQAEYVLGRPLPCQDLKGQQCPYAGKWGIDPDDYDVLIGHYNHAHKPKVTAGRTVVLDEFPDAYETTLTTRLQPAVSYWLETTPEIPYDDYTDLLENRDDQQRRAEALLWFEKEGVNRDEGGVLDDLDAHADAPIAVYAILAAASGDLGNGFERAELPERGVTVRNRRTGSVSILRPPELQYNTGVVCLDGTPTQEMWELATGKRLNHRPVLQNAERCEYVSNALNLNLVATSNAVKPYNSADHITVKQDAALLEEIHELHNEQPAVITTATAEAEYYDTAVEDHVADTTHYGNVLGSNRYKQKRVGAVIGSNHYGDGYLKKWGAFAGECVERNGGKGAELSYGEFGDRVLTHMREHETLQAAMRFGRDGNGAVVYVHTDTLPEWVPIAAEGRVVSTWSDGMRDVLAAMEATDGATTAEIAADPAVDVSERQVFDHLERLRERGVVSREQDTDDARRVIWQDDEIHRVNEHGEVSLDAVSVDELDSEEVDELGRTTTYTWEFVKRQENRGDDAASAPAPADEPTPATSKRGMSGSTPPD